jgi:hypothetical protein
MKTINKDLHSNYITTCEYALERDADYKEHAEVQKLFIACGDPNFEWNGFSGNLAMHFKMNRKTKKFKVTKDWSCSDETHASLYQAIPSALVLYRLCAFDENVKVQALGQEGYKCVWQIAFIHVASRRLVVFGEHKGAFSFWTDGHGAELKEDKQLVKDLTRFLNYLCSDKYAHPYDGLVAGSVA